MKKLTAILFASTMLISCSALKRAKINREKRKLETLIKKYQVDSTVKSDTVLITKYDTLVIPEETVDTVQVLDLVDTIIIETERIRNVVIREHDTFKITNTIKRLDTVFISQDSIIYRDVIKTVDLTKSDSLFNLNGTKIYWIFVLLVILLTVLYIYKIIKA